MTRYWIKIIVGALLVFAAGMAVWFGVRKGVTTVHTVLETSNPINIPLKFVTFRVDGVALGRLEQLKMLRTTPKAISSVEVTVRVDSAAAAERLRQCTMRIDDLNHIDEHTTFVCVAAESPADSGAFMPFGTVSIAGTDIVMPLYLPAASVRDLQHQGFRAADSIAPPSPPELPAVPAQKAPVAVP